MLERMLLPRQHAISILLRDHDNVKRLFRRFERAKSAAEKETILRDAIMRRLATVGVVLSLTALVAIRTTAGPALSRLLPRTLSSSAATS